MILTEYDQERHIKNEKQTSYSEGYKEGSIKTAIQIYKDFGMENAEIYGNIMKKFGLTEKEAKVFLEKKE